MFDVVLVHPEIPPNTGNVMRLCANTGARLHLVRPLGFELDDARLRRAGLDYREWVDVRVHDSLAAALAGVPPTRRFAFSTHGAHRHCDVRFAAGDALVFGCETRGLGEHLAAFAEERILRLPMVAGSRSLNLSNAVAVAVFEAWRQLDFRGAGPTAG
jgi:tRNA (cytidine/uridine-2'-O-)-methyltransferase